MEEEVYKQCKRRVGHGVEGVAGDGGGDGDGVGLEAFQLIGQFRRWRWWWRRWRWWYDC